MISQPLTDWPSLLQVFQTQPEQRPAVLEHLMQEFEAGDFQVQWEVARLLYEIGVAAIQPLVTLMQDDEQDLELRWMAARTLGELGRPEVISPLVALLCAEDNPDLQDMAAIALANLGDLAVEPLAQLLDREARQLPVVKALAQIRSRATIEPLLRLVQAADSRVRGCVVEALSSFHDRRIPPLLLAALHDPDTQVRVEAIAGLSLRSDLAAELNLLNRFAESLSDPDLEVSGRAAGALGRLGNDAAADQLATALGTAPLPLQRELIRALGRVATPSAVVHLRATLASPSVAVVRESVSVLGRLGASLGPAAPVPGEVLLALLSALQHPDPEVKKLAAIGLAQVGDPIALEPLVQSLAEPEPAVRLHVIAALEKIDRAGAQQRVEQNLLQDNLDADWRQGLQAFLREELDRDLRASAV